MIVYIITIYESAYLLKAIIINNLREGEALPLLFFVTENSMKLYECDPRKNTECKKPPLMCGSICTKTKKKKFSKGYEEKRKPKLLQEGGLDSSTESVSEEEEVSM